MATRADGSLAYLMTDAAAFRKGFHQTVWHWREECARWPAARFSETPAIHAFFNAATDMLCASCKGVSVFTERHVGTFSCWRWIRANSPFVFIAAFTLTSSISSARLALTVTPHVVAL